MPSSESETPQAALLRVLLAGDAEAPELIRKIRDWTGGRVQLDEATFEQMVSVAERAGLVTRHAGATDKHTHAPRLSWSLTSAGRSSAVEILADSLTRRP
jgi:DNA-binding PadR family transcriptional regulator